MTFEAGAAVRSVDNPARQGVLTNVAPRARPSGTYVHVRWNDGATDFVHTDELEPLDNLDLSDPFALIQQGKYGRAADLRRNLTFAHLSGRLANLVYSMGITNTDFYAHQYRPLLTLLESPSNGLLIADEVGLGKTIEAGLIWTELRARFDLRRLVVVCPAMLREKWQAELRLRFGVDAIRVDAVNLIDELTQPSASAGEGRALIISYQAARPPREWRPASSLKPQRPGPRWRLADLLHDAAEQEPLIDMVVFDEAHYMRNTDTASWRLGELLRDASSYQLMLSATPINLHNRDLFNLLRLIDPDHFVSEDDFQRLIETNRPLVAARDLVLDRRSQAQDILEGLRDATEDPLLARSQQLAAILADPPDDERLKSAAYRAELADALERVNLLSHVVTRTRKRDVEERRVHRAVQREGVPMTPTERALYEAVTEATRDYAFRNGISDGFLLATPQRMITSCPAAIAEAWAAGSAALAELEEDIEAEYQDEADADLPPISLRETIAALVPRAIDIADLRRNDSKFRRLIEVAGAYLNQHAGEKLVIFTTYRATARYLAKRLTEEGLPARLLMGGQAQTKQDVIDEFRTSNTLRALVSTEVASEGVDLQFCRVLVNYDLPWNPTRVEQRIGRIDRLGQKSDLIQIWNLYFEGTIDERIISRLLDRLRIFEEALGEAEAVVGDTIRRLEAELLSRPLTPEEEERQIDLAAQALEYLRRQREELERNAAHMMAHGQRIIERIEAARELSRRVTEDDLLVYTRDYLSRYWTGHRFAPDGHDPRLVTIQLPGDLAATLDEFMRAEGLAGKSHLPAGLARPCRFLNKISEAGRRGEEVIHQFHPLIRYISRDLKLRNEHFYPLIAVRTDRQALGGAVPAGRYAFYVRTWVFKGVRDEEFLSAAALDLDTGRLLDDEASDRLLQAARLSGEDWLEAGSTLPADLVAQRLEDAEGELDRRYREARQRKQNENSDRARFQLDSIQRHLDRRLPTLMETMQAHLARGNKSLAAATQGQIAKLNARMNARRERIRQQEQVAAERLFVCAGVIELT
jgi:superfamily II DNA or RNA helicase